MIKIILVALGILIGFGSCQNCDFNYVKKYTIDGIVNDAKIRDNFMMDIMTWEGKFATDKIGLNYKHGLTYDGTSLNYSTGLPDGGLHDFSAASKESVHLGLLALAISGSKYATKFFESGMQGVWAGDVQSYVIDQLTKKITAYEKWNSTYPGFGGYLPWYNVNDDDGMALLPNWNNAVPGLDNGEMIWGMIAVIQALKDNGYADLAKRYQNYIDYLALTGLQIFLNKSIPGIACVSGIPDINSNPFDQTYNTSTGCMLDDPYEGELFFIFLELYSDWTNFGGTTVADQIWDKKLKMAQSVQFTTTGGAKITVERGYWFSSHEQWKFMELPYFDVDIANRVYLNGERARSHFSWQKNFPGMFAAVTNVSDEVTFDQTHHLDYVSDCGIAEIAFNPIRNNNLFTPYGAYPMMLHPDTRAYGLAWYANSINASRMQGPQGSTEAIWIDGSMISPVQTWDSKITSVLAMNGGMLDLTRKYLINTGRYAKFAIRVQNQWTEVFGDSALPGSDLDFKLPNTQFPTANKEFPCI